MWDNEHVLIGCSIEYYYYFYFAMCFNIILSFFFLPYFILFITFLLRVPTHIYRLERYDFICFGGKSFSFSCFGGLRKKTKMKVLISLLFDVPILHFAKSKFMLFVNKSCIAYFFEISTHYMITFRSILQNTLQTMKNVLPSETLNESYMDNSCNINIWIKFVCSSC